MLATSHSCNLSWVTVASVLPSGEKWREPLSGSCKGVGIGLPLAAGLTQFMSSQLFQIKAIDPVIYGGAALMFIIVAGLACAGPG